MADRYSPTGLYAVYECVWIERYTNGTEADCVEMLQEPVVAFDSEGNALVCHHETGKLVRAAGSNPYHPEEWHQEDGGEVHFYWIRPGHQLVANLDTDSAE